MLSYSRFLLKVLKFLTSSFHSHRNDPSLEDFCFLFEIYPYSFRLYFSMEGLQKAGPHDGDEPPCALLSFLDQSSRSDHG